MARTPVVLLCLLSGSCFAASHPSFDYDTARTHELKPHRRTIPMEGVREGFNQLHLTLTVSPIGDVTHAEAGDAPDNLKFWPQIEGEVYQWKFTPFEKNGKPVTAEVEEYVDLVPPEQLPKTHIAPPVLKPDSKVSITLERSGCMGDCPGYTVTVSNQEILFDGGGNTVASGLQTDKISSDEVHKLAERFVAADFFSMWPTYSASVTDCPTYILSINVDGNSQKVVDYMGQWVGMPAVIAELEDEVDSVAGTKRWIEGSDGLVQALQAEKFNFHTFEAQVILKASARRGQTTTVHQLLEAGTPIKPLPAPKPKESYESIPFEHIGFLTAASSHPDSLQVLIDAGASKEDQNDKNSALIGAAESGKVSAVKALIGYGANPNADLSKLTVTHEGGGMIMEGQGAGSVLIYAAASGNPEMIREILKYNPHLEARDREGKTAIFAAGTYEYRDEDGVRVECVRILAKAGANINAKDNDGNTPLHETFLTDVEEELLKLGANVNARNNDGETPIFTTVDNDAIPLFIEHGADLTIRNNKGETVVEAAKSKGPYRQEALRKAIQALNQP